MFEVGQREDRPYPPVWRRSDEDNEIRDRIAMLMVLGGGILAGLIVAWNLTAGFAGLNAQVDLARLQASELAPRKLSGYQPSASGASSTCTPDKPVFDARFNDLQRRLSSLIGAPGECAHPSAAAGDIVQQTSTGLAILRASNGNLIFTNGLEHWALTGGGLVFWTGSGVDPPGDAVPVADGLVRPEAAPSAQQAATDSATVSGTEGTGVVLRASPSDDDWTPRGFMDGAQVTVLERSGAEWARVRGDNGQEGWVPGRYIVP